MSPFAQGLGASGKLTASMANLANRIGIIGGGQLARMSTHAAQRLGYETVILDPDANAPAAQVTPHVVLGRWDAIEPLRALAERCAVLTLENEWVSPDLLKTLEDDGHSVIPGSQTLALIGDKFVQRERFHAANLPGPRAVALTTWDDARRLTLDWGCPLVLKARSGGYDGYGVRILRSEQDWEKLPTGDPKSWFAEEYVPFARELAVMVARRADGSTAIYPVVESVQTEDGYKCDFVTAPAPHLSDALRQHAEEIAVRCVEAVHGVGLFGVELFLTADGHLSVNEIAPRPHNSGHYTMDACITSQFEQHIRAVCDLKLGPTDLTAPAAVMANLLAPRDGAFDLPAAVHRALSSHPEAHLHWYGKATLRTGRKMGHLTVTADSHEEARAGALRARNAFWRDDA